MKPKLGLGKHICQSLRDKTRLIILIRQELCLTIRLPYLIDLLAYLYIPA